MMVKVNLFFFFGQEDNSEKKEEETVEEEKWEENFKEHHDSRPRGKILFSLLCYCVPPQRKGLSSDKQKNNKHNRIGRTWPVVYNYWRQEKETANV